MRTIKNYYDILNKKIQDFESSKHNSSMQLSKIADKVVWCFRWRKISNEECNELCDRITKLYNSRSLGW